MMKRIRLRRHLMRTSSILPAREREPRQVTSTTLNLAPTSTLTDRIHLLVNAACAARASAAQMTLSDWRDVEQEVEQRLENEKREAKRN